MILHFNNSDNNRLIIAALLIFILFYFVSFSITGPAYLSDEIGYLTKAIYISGNGGDFASSWHAGYSILISPVFYFLNDFNDIWTAIKIINISLFVASFIFMYFTLVRVFPKKDKGVLLLGAIIGMIYPSWMVMSSYAFVTPFLLFMYTALVYSFLSIEKSTYNVVICSILSSYAYWIHPTGIVVSLSCFLTLALFSFTTRRWSIIVIYSIILFFCIFCYCFIVKDSINSGMASEFYTSRQHYSEINILEHIFSEKSWRNFWLVFLGVSVSSVISSLGLTFFAFTNWIAPKIYSLWVNKDKSKCFSVVDLIPLFLTFVFLFSVLIQCVYTLTLQELRFDWFVYGRYLEPFSILLIPIGIITVWNKSSAKWLPCFFSFVIIFYIVFLDVNDVLDVINVVNIPSLWVRLFDFSVIPSFNFIPIDGIKVKFIAWFLCGCIVILFVYLSGKKVFIFSYLLSIVFCVINSNEYHKLILQEYSNPYKIDEFFNANFKEDKCVVFDIDKYRNVKEERYNLLSYYLFKYDYYIAPFSYWDENCDGVFITQNSQKYNNFKNVKPIIKNKHDGLTVFVKSNNHFEYNTSMLSNEDYFIKGFGEDVCFNYDCFFLSVKELSRYRQVGTIVGSSLVSNNEQGYLFFGPYLPIHEGYYGGLLDIKGDSFDNVILDIVGDKGRYTVFRKSIGELMQIGDKKGFKFHVNYKLEDFEVRLWVGDKSNVKIKSLNIKSLNH
nr:hypothetical protein [uncultured Tolumonas sp.]